MAKSATGEREWADVIYRRPSPEQIRDLEASHGWEACLERWGYLSTRTLLEIKKGVLVHGRSDSSRRVRA